MHPRYGCIKLKSIKILSLFAFQIVRVYAT